jgi:hypothetical protein
MIVTWLVRLRMRVPRPRARAATASRSTLFGVGPSDEQLVGRHVVVVLGVGDGGVEELLELGRDRAVAQRQGGRAR